MGGRLTGDEQTMKGHHSERCRDEYGRIYYRMACDVSPCPYCRPPTQTDNSQAHMDAIKSRLGAALERSRT